MNTKKHDSVRQTFICKHLCMPLLVAGFCIVPMLPEAWAFPVTPTTLSYSASVTSPTPPSQSVTFSKKSLVTRTWSASGSAPWMSISPSTGTISREQDQLMVNVNATGLAAGTYSGTVNIMIGGQMSAVNVTLMVAGGTATPTSSTPTPSLRLNPLSINISGKAGGTAPLPQTFNITNPTGGTLTWTLTESAPWLGLNITSGTTTTEVDAISASASLSGLAAGTYSTAIVVAASGASNSPQTIPVTLTLSPPTTTGTASLRWDPSTDSNLSGYNLYMGTQSGLYGSPISVGMTTSYTAGNLTGGKTYYFSVTAVSTGGTESSRSNEVTKTIQ